MTVTPFTGVWIEMEHGGARACSGFRVTPFTGVWIEIEKLQIANQSISNVTPFTGVWIEIAIRFLSIILLLRHSLHGSVD